MAKAPSATLKQMVRAYLDDLQVRSYTPKTINGYAKNLAMFVKWAETQGATTLADLDTELAKRYIRYLQEKPKYAERGYSTVSAERVTPRPSATMCATSKHSHVGWPKNTTHQSMCWRR